MVEGNSANDIHTEHKGIFQKRSFILFGSV